MTLYRRRVQYGLVHPAYQTLNDAQLQATVREIHSQQPTLGEVMVWERIRARGFYVSRQRLRRAIRITDPLHTALRWRGDLTCHATNGPPKIGPPGPSVAIFVAINGPPGPSMAAIDGPPGPSTAPYVVPPCHRWSPSQKSSWLVYGWFSVSSGHTKFSL